MSALEYVTRLTLAGVVAGGFWVGGRALRLWLVPSWTGAPAALAGIVAALSVAVVAAELLGVVGLLGAPALAIFSIGTAVALTLRRPPARYGPPPPSVTVGKAALALAVGASLLTAVRWAGPVFESLDVGIYRQDSLWYHLPLAAWFAQTGSVGGLLFTDPLKLTVWYYPLNTELLHAIGMVALGNDLLSPLLNYGWMGAALLAAWCVGRPFGRAAATLLGGILVVGSDMMIVQAGNAPSDIAALALLLAAVAILANGVAARGGRVGPDSEFPAGLAVDRGPLAVAALAAGLAIGAKVTMLVPVGVITVGILLAADRDRARRAAVWVGGLLATGGFWYLRNLVHAGNPLPWIHFGPLPGPHQEDLYPRPAHSIAEYVTESHAWTAYFFPGLHDTLGPLWFLVAFAVFAGIVLGLRRSNGRLVRLLALTAVATLVAHALTPISASGPEGSPIGFASNLRYAAPGLALALVVLPLCESRAIVNRVIVPAYAVLIAVAAIFSSEWIQPKPAAAIAVGGATVLAAIWLARSPAGPRVRLAVAGLVAVAVIAGYPQQRQYFHDRYRADVAPPLDNPGFRATDQWRQIQTWAREQHGLRIGIVGTPAAYGQYIFYGGDLSNEVRYLGEPRPAGGFGPIETCNRWREAIDAGGFDAVVITPEDLGSALLPPQIRWTALGGEAKPTLNVLPAAVFQLTGPLEPGLCGRSSSASPSPWPGGRGPGAFPPGIGPRFKG